MSRKAHVQTQAKTTAAPTVARTIQPPVAEPEREAVWPNIATQLDGAARLGHSLGAISMDSFAPAIIQRQELPEEEEEEIQMKPDIPRVGLKGGQVAPDVEAAINCARSGGRPLDGALQEQMGETLGHDFSGVRVHTDAEADALNQQFGAKAFTTGMDVFFLSGEYNSGSDNGHELSHVVQQSTGRVLTGSLGLSVRPPNDAFEREADRVAEAVTGAVSSPPQPELEEEEEVPVQMKTEPETAWQRLQEQKLQAQPALTPPTLDGVPRDEDAAGMVWIKSSAWAVWMASGNPSCIEGGVRLHEEKHVSDFKADPDYKDFPMKTGESGEGKTIYYGSAADARRFEHPAIDIEIKWLKKQLEGNPSAGDKRIMENRANVVLPAYKASFS